MDPPHLVAKIGYQGIRCYVTATDPTLRSEEKLNESPRGASSQYYAFYSDFGLTLKVNLRFVREDFRFSSGIATVQEICYNNQNLKGF